tara:strand:- start:12 stop:629 length:618 start_codon:yes stop_codon:yes gene_type:complete
MALWGTAHASATNKPKYLPDNKNSNYDITHCYADQSGWVMRAGSKATGNGNVNAKPEILVAIKALAGATAATGLKHPTITRARWTSAALTHGSGVDISVSVTWDEQVKYTAGSFPAIATLKGGSAGGPALTLDLIDGVAYHATTNHTGSTFRFKGTTNGAGTITIDNNTAMSNPGTLTDAVSTTALASASYTLVTAVLPGNCVVS